MVDNLQLRIAKWLKDENVGKTMADGLFYVNDEHNRKIRVQEVEIEGEVNRIPQSGGDLALWLREVEYVI
jgi:hypothetical protein